MITLATRFSTCRGSLIDNFISKYSDTMFNAVSGILLDKFSDHQPYFTSLELVRTYQTTPKYIRVYDKSGDSLKKFSEEFNLTNLSTVLDKSPSADPTLNYNILEDILCELKNKHFQSKFVKFNKYKHKKSPWITTGILRSIKFQNQLYKQFRKAPVNSEEACTLRTNLKTYNCIIKKCIIR